MSTRAKCENCGELFPYEDAKLTADDVELCPKCYSAIAKEMVKKKGTKNDTK